MAIGTVRVGIVGVGNNAAPHRGPAYQRLPQVELTVCCATLLPRAEVGAQRLGIAKACADVGTMIRMQELDVVSICVPNDAHSQKALNAPTPARTSCAKSPWRKISSLPGRCATRLPARTGRPW